MQSYLFFCETVSIVIVIRRDIDLMTKVYLQYAIGIGQSIG